MNKNFITYAFVLAAFLFSSVLCGAREKFGKPVSQVPISRVDAMQNLPKPYKILDWHQKALDFDAYVFDFDSELPGGTCIWLDFNERNYPQTTFGLYTAMKDARQGPDRNNGEFHESLNSLHCLLSAGLNGIDKTNQDGYNYVKMAQNYFNHDTGWNIMMNNTCPEVALLGGGYGRDWWYDVFPNILYYAVCELFPGVENSDYIQRSIAEQFCKADSTLAGNYNFSYFDYGKMEGRVNHIPLQQDAAGGHAWVLYAAYQKFGDQRYLEHAKSAMDALESQTESRFYEILLPMGIYTAARLNAEHGCNYDLAKMFDWVFDGCKAKDGRYGWGITCGRWGRYDISGLQGSLTDGNGFAFLMNSIDVAWPFVPLVKYQPQYARAIGKWMLNNTNSCRLFFPDQIPDKNQCLPGMQDYTNSIIAYEGLRYEDRCDSQGRKRNVHPVAIGDGPLWYETNPKESMFSIYSTSAVGILGAIVKTTDVKGILKLDCNATDFYSDKQFPEYLFYNPYKRAKTVTYKATSGCKDLFDIVSRTYLAKNVKGAAAIKIPADSAVLVVELPAESEIILKNDKLIVNNTIIVY